MRALNHFNRCQHCNKVFESNRYDARYCGSSCRVKAKRKDEKNFRERDEAQDALNTLIQGAKERGYRSKLDFEALQHMERRLQSVLVMFENES